MIYPDNPARDQFYSGSSTLVDNGDNIRLQDISLSYDFNKTQLKKLPFSALQLYLYANNIGLLWTANKDHIDPDFPTTGPSGIPLIRTISMGIKAGL